MYKYNTLQTEQIWGFFYPLIFAFKAISYFEPLDYIERKLKFWEEQGNTHNENIKALHLIKKMWKVKNQDYSKPHLYIGDCSIISIIIIKKERLEPLNLQNSNCVTAVWIKKLSAKKALGGWCMLGSLDPKLNLVEEYKEWFFQNNFIEYDRIMKDIQRKFPWNAYINFLTVN